MTLSQTHFRFKLLFDKIDSFSLPELSPEEIDEFLNLGQEELLMMITRKGIESTQEYTDMLKNIVISYTSTTFVTGTTNKPHSVFVVLPSGYRTAILEEATLSYVNCNEETIFGRADVHPMTRDRYLRIMKDPFNKPDKDNVIRLASAPINSQEVFELVLGEGITLTEYHLDYIRDPVRIQYGTQYNTVTTDVDCELNEKAQELIIKLAVGIAEQVLAPKQLQKTEQ